jgi:hypothetical protein
MQFAINYDNGALNFRYLFLVIHHFRGVIWAVDKGIIPLDCNRTEI